jgi:hypothetical protein
VTVTCADASVSVDSRPTRPWPACAHWARRQSWYALQPTEKPHPQPTRSRGLCPKQPAVCEIGELPLNSTGEIGVEPTQCTVRAGFGAVVATLGRARRCPGLTLPIS